MRSLSILLASPRGFCAGVERAIETVEESLDRFGAPVFVRHQIVHNPWVVSGLAAKGTIFVEELDEVPDGAPVVFSAHGVAKSVRSEAERRRLPHIDATCPLVTKVHREVEHHSAADRKIILIGHAGHPEVVGTMGQAPDGSVILVQSAAEAAAIAVDGSASYGLVTQTTLSVMDAGRSPPFCVVESPSYMRPRRATSATRRPTGREPSRLSRRAAMPSS